MIKHEIKFVVLKFTLLDQTLVHKKKKEHKNTIEMNWLQRMYTFC